MFIQTTTYSDYFKLWSDQNINLYSLPQNVLSDLTDQASSQLKRLQVKNLKYRSILLDNLIQLLDKFLFDLEEVENSKIKVIL